MELSLSQEAVSQLLEAKEKAEERAEKAIEDLCREYFSCSFNLSDLRHAFNL